MSISDACCWRAFLGRCRCCFEGVCEQLVGKGCGFLLYFNICLLYICIFFCGVADRVYVDDIGDSGGELAACQLAGRRDTGKPLFLSVFVHAARW